MWHAQREMHSQEEDIEEDHMGEEGGKAQGEDTEEEKKIKHVMYTENGAIWPKIVGTDIRGG